MVQVAERVPEGGATRNRELAALREAMREHPKSRAILVTRGDEDDTVKAPEGIITILPIWRYLLEAQSVTLASSILTILFILSKLRTHEL